jgi:anthranilate phosphoribosyltransferase
MPRSARETLEFLLAGACLDEARADEVFTSIFAGEWDASQIAAMLAMIQFRGVRAEELTGAARAMRRHVTPVPITPVVARGIVLDTCGTGGAPKTFNVSTAAAFVVAAAAGPTAEGYSGRRVYVAKHGNRGRTGRGSAEVLACLGANIESSPDAQAATLERCGVCFCFAVHHHPAMRFAAPVRHALGFPTIFNLLGPLTNPAGAPRQLMGVYRAEYVDLVARTHAALGTEKAIVLHSDDGLDEISIFAPTRIAIAERGSLRNDVIDGPALLASRGGSAGVPPAGETRLEVLQARDAIDAARMIRAALDPRAVPAGPSRAARDMVVLNAAAALVVADAASGMAQAIAMADGAIASGAAARVLDDFLRG